MPQSQTADHPMAQWRNATITDYRPSYGTVKKCQYIKNVCKITDNRTWSPFKTNIPTGSRFRFISISKNKWVCPGNATITDCRPSHGTVKKGHNHRLQTILWHSEEMPQSQTADHPMAQWRNATMTDCRPSHGTVKKCQNHRLQTIPLHSEEMPLLSIGRVHFHFKGCWVVFFFFIHTLIEQSVSKQWKTLFCIVCQCPIKRTLGLNGLSKAPSSLYLSKMIAKLEWSKLGAYHQFASDGYTNSCCFLVMDQNELHSY